jgi:hypothetical protein
MLQRMELAINRDLTHLVALFQVHGIVMPEDLKTM